MHIQYLELLYPLTFNVIIILTELNTIYYILGIFYYQLYKWISYLRYTYTYYLFQVDFIPTIVQKFDTSIHIKIRGWKTISLRVGGRVEEPRVDIDKVRYFRIGKNKF